MAPFDKFGADDIGLREPFRLRLDGVTEGNAPLRARAEQPLEGGQIVGRGDDENLAHAGEHQRAQRIIDHRLVVDRKQLLRGHERHGMKPRAASPGENDAAHEKFLS